MNRSYPGILIAALCASAVLLFSGILVPVEQRLLDLRTRWLSRQIEPDSRIVLIEIDEMSLRRFGAWPWPRSIFAEVVSHCTEARAVVVDILFAEPDHADPANDAALATALRTSGNVVLASLLVQDGPEVPARDGAGGSEMVQYADRVPPRAELEAAAAGTGFVNYLTDTDGVVRSHLLVAETGGTAVPSLALRAVQQFADRPADPLSFRGGKVTAGDDTFPVDRFGRFRMVPVAQPYATVSFSEALSVPDSFFADRIVFIGSTAAGLQADRQVTPIQVYTPGVLAVAWASDGLLNRRFLRVPSRLPVAVLGLLLTLAPFLLPLRRPRPVLISLAAQTAGLAALLGLALARGHWMLPLAPLLSCTILGHIAVGAAAWRTERRERRRLEGLERRKQQFTDMLVHDLKNLLAPLTMSLSLQGERGDAPSHVQLARQSATRMGVMLNTLLDIRRTEEGRLRVETEPMSVEALLEAVGDSYHEMAAHRDLQLAVRSDGAPESATLDPELTRRILDNLVLNALQYADPGSAIGLCASHDEDALRIVVQNDGPAILPKDREHILDLFEAGAESSRRAFSGTGIGLAFCRIAAEAMGGRIEVETPWRNGQGVRIVLRFPRGAD